ncbi:MAG: hypothetical protein K0R49_813 [Burkholderiales bacterium]|nr:hypothetical protein [Burkholderiales bacterium]
MQPGNCILCDSKNEDIVFTNDLFRIVHIKDIYYPGYVRLILNRHAAHMTDINEKEAHSIFSALLIIERCVRDILNPDRINLACFGNIVSHLHWHIIPRYKNDRHFPNPIWGEVTNTKYFVADYLIGLEQQFLAQIYTKKFI